MNTAIVSIIMPMRNAQDFVAKSIDSILKQSFKEIELIIVDDFSTDSSRNIVERYAENDSRINLVIGDGQGIASAKNKGMAMAIGQLFMFCDADDLIADNRIAEQVAFFQQYPEYQAVCGRFALMDSSGGKIVELGITDIAGDITNELLSGATRTHLCAYMIRRELVQAIGGFRCFFVSAEDIDFQLRLAENGKVFFNTEIVYFYRLHDASTVHTQASSQRVFYEETAREFRRQRSVRGQDDLQLGYIPIVPEALTAPVNSKRQLQGALIGQAWYLHQHSQKLRAIIKGFEALLVELKNLDAWKCLVFLCLK